MGHLVDTREMLRDDRAVGCRLEREVGLATVVVRTLTSQSDDNGRLREVIIKCLMDRCQLFEMDIGLYTLPPREIMSMGSSAS